MTDARPAPGWHIGFEPPNLCFLRLTGDLDGPSAEDIFAEIRPFAAEQGFVLLLVDVSGVGAVEPAARRVGIDSSRDIPLRGIALCGASFTFRVIATLVHNAAILLHKHRDNPIRFFDGEADARAWLAERARQEHANRR
jgi:hypothetical protein